MRKRLRSRILEFIPKNALRDLQRICDRKDISDNNDKVRLILKALDYHDVSYEELGPGTNRVAVLIDGYVFKIAMDKWGVRDNMNEFASSQELYPYVTKVYETNELITVSEYVTVISREEFMERTEELREILSLLAESYLLGDVGTVTRNFCNWGYRDSGDLVILDFGYIYKIRPDKLVCSLDGEVLDYDENFHNLVCFKCGKKYDFMAIRRRISTKEEAEEHQLAKLDSYELTKPVQEFNEEDDERYEEDDYTSFLYKSAKPKEEEAMLFNRQQSERFIDEDNKSYMEALNSMSKVRVEHQDTESEIVPSDNQNDNQSPVVEPNLIESNTSKIVINESDQDAGLIKHTTITQEEKIYIPTGTPTDIIIDPERIEKLNGLLESVENERNGILPEDDNEESSEEEEEAVGENVPDAVELSQSVTVVGDQTTVTQSYSIKDADLSRDLKLQADAEAARLRAEIQETTEERAEKLAEEQGYGDYVE